MRHPLPGSVFSFAVPPGGTVLLSVSALNPNDPTKAGWARLESTSGSLTGVATCEYAIEDHVLTTVAFPQAQLLQIATIPVETDTARDMKVAYGIANPGMQPISIRLYLIGPDGAVVDDSVTVTLGPRQQIARYLWQDFARENFKGSVVLQSQTGASFIAVALAENQGLYSVIPLLPGGFPGIPD